MKCISWNVNGLRAVVKKNFMDVFNELDADFFCLQETKLQAGQIDLELPGYHQYWNYAEKKGYSGTAIFAKEEAVKCSLWLRYRGSRSRRPRDHFRISRIFHGHLLHTKLTS